MNQAWYININRYLENTIAEGPGKRFCIWVQGCLRKCPSCCNAHMQPIVPKLILPVDEVCRLILISKKENNIEGITFLGGEPLLQASGLGFVAEYAQAIGLSVIVFTGFLLSECLDKRLPGVSKLLAHTDILIDGPFIESKIDDDRNWVGSSNQVFHYLTDKYSYAIEKDPQYRNLVEIRLTDNGVYGNGCPKTMTPIPQVNNDGRQMPENCSGNRAI